MKRTAHIYCLYLVALLVLSEPLKSQPISDHFFGVNAWMPEAIGDVGACTNPPCALFGDMNENWGNVKGSSAQIVRFGGIAVDRNKPTNEQYIKMIDSIRTQNMEPIIQVPFFDNKYSAQDAAAIVTYINIVQGKQIKYWIIANEPDLVYSYHNAQQIASYFRTYASAMKNVDPGIIIIGPETATFTDSIVTALTTPGGPNDLTGKDAAGRYYLDIFSFHAYPLGAGNQTRADVINKLTSVNGFEDDLKYLKARLEAADAYHLRTGPAKLKMAVTEANINFRNHAQDDVNGLCTNSFIGGQFIAEMYGIGMKHGVGFMNLWSVIEGNNNPQNTGYIDSQSGIRKPNYYRFQMMAENFSGTYIPSRSSNSTVKSFACRKGNETVILLLNEHVSQNFPFTMNLNEVDSSSGASLVISADAGMTVNYNDILSSQSTVLLVFNNLGQLVKRCDYSLTGQATNADPPSCSDDPMGLRSEELQKPDFAVFPNPATGKITVDFTGRSDEPKKISIYDPLGRCIRQKVIAAETTSAMIDLSDASKGVYFIEVLIGNNKVVKKLVMN